MADNILTPYFRAGFISVFKPSKPANSNQDPKYSIRALFPPNTDLSALKKAAEQVAKAKWPAGVPKTMRSPFRRNEELENPVPGIGDDWIVMTFSAPADRRPGIVDAKLQDIIDEVEVYPGAWYRAQVNPFAYEQQGNKGVSFGLVNVQKIKNDEPLGSGRVPANKAFDAVETAEGSDAGSLFD